MRYGRLMDSPYPVPMATGSMQHVSIDVSTRWTDLLVAWKCKECKQCSQCKNQQNKERKNRLSISSRQHNPQPFPFEFENDNECECSIYCKSSDDRAAMFLIRCHCINLNIIGNYTIAYHFAVVSTLRSWYDAVNWNFAARLLTRCSRFHTLPILPICGSIDTISNWFRLLFSYLVLSRSNCRAVDCPRC